MSKKKILDLMRVMCAKRERLSRTIRCMKTMLRVEHKPGKPTR